MIRKHAAHLCFAALGLGASLPAVAVGLHFIIPSGATSEASRLYFKLAREFEHGAPDIQITFQPLADWDDVVHTVKALRAQHKSAGVFVAEVSETWELERLGLIESFDDALGGRDGALKSFQARFAPAFLGNSYCANGKFCGPPFVRSTPVALYNLDALRRAGVPTGHLPATWDELEALLEKLRAATGRPPFLFGGDWYDYLFEATVRQAGGTLMNPHSRRVTLATPEAVEALRFWRRLKDKDLLFRANNWKGTLNGFASGFYPVTYYSSGGLETVRSQHKFDWTADMLPKSKMYGVATGGGNLYLSAGMRADEKNAAIRFAQFLYSPAVQARISHATGFFPVVDAAFEEPALRERYSGSAAFKRARQQLQYAQPKLMAAENLKVRQILKSAIDRCLNDGVAPEPALARAQREVDALLPR